MAKKGGSKLPMKWIFLAGIAIVVLVVWGLFSNTPTQPSSAYQTYQDPTRSFTIEYPEAWEIRKDTQVFENGDAIAFGISGPTQKERTELTDGAQLAVSQPFTITSDLSVWIKQYFNSKAEFSSMTVAGRVFETVYDCTGGGCMRYFYTLINGQVYGIAIFAEGPDQDKMVYENTTLHMFKSLKFPKASIGTVSEEDATAKVSQLPEVIAYLKRVPNGLVLVNGQEDNAYMVQVYEFKNDHTATFNWYKVDKTSGAVDTVDN